MLLFLRFLSTFKQGRTIFPLPPFHALAVKIAFRELFMITNYWWRCNWMFTTISRTRFWRWVRTIQIVDRGGILHRNPAPTSYRRIVIAKMVRILFVHLYSKNKILFQQLPFFDAMAFGFVVTLSDAGIGQSDQGIELCDKICTSQQHQHKKNTP